ncbi:hypothetical protein K525DRAFT_282185 [Schizophyllum commune Loenen D]|nr:hypothetical protein K525DRAFT_282185 [Schizophyllum commune Loenen D]
MNNRSSTAACEVSASLNGSINPVDAIDKKTLEWIETGLPGLSPDDLRAVLARFFKDQDRAKAPTATMPAKAANASVTGPGIAGNAQAQRRNPPVYPPPPTHTQRGGSSYHRSMMTAQPGHLPAGQMPTFTYTPPAFAQVAMPPPSQYTRVDAQQSTKTSAQRSEKTAARPSTKTGASCRPLPPTWTEATKAQTGATRPATGAPKRTTGGSNPAANVQKNALPAPRVIAAPSEPAASRMPGASRSSKRKVRSGSLERASVQRSAKKAAQVPAPSEA